MIYLHARSQSVGRANIMSSALGAIFYVEFDNQYGRALTFQEPHDAIAAEEFDAISDYLIPKPQLCGQLIALRLPASRIVLCFPMMIEDEKYERNALIFALGFVLADGVEDATCERHGPPLRKACSHLAALEIESQLLSDSSKKGELAHLLPRILHELQDRGECIVAADAANIIRLQLPGVAVRASMAVPPALPSSASASLRWMSTPCLSWWRRRRPAPRAAGTSRCKSFSDGLLARAPQPRSRPSRALTSRSCLLACGPSTRVDGCAWSTSLP